MGGRSGDGWEVGGWVGGRGMGGRSGDGWEIGGWVGGRGMGGRSGEGWEVGGWVGDRGMGGVNSPPSVTLIPSSRSFYSLPPFSHCAFAVIK